MKVHDLRSAPVLAAALSLRNPQTSVEAFSTTYSGAAIHSVGGIPCRELAIHIRSLGTDVTILEATEEGQERLVDAVLTEGDDGDRDVGEGWGGDGGFYGNSVREDPYGAVLWPAASAVSEYITADSFWDEEKRTGRTVLELGTGTGLVALSASASDYYSSILATDYETVPLSLIVAAHALNRERREGSSPMTPISTSLFDICDFSTPLPPADLVCAADILYEPKTGIALARRTVEALERGSRVVVGCSPGRPGRPAFLEDLARLRPDVRGAEFVDVEGTTCTGKRHSLICGEGSTSVSEEPRMLQVALMDLTPDCLD